MQDGRHQKFSELVTRLNSLIADAQSNDQEIKSLLDQVVSYKEQAERNASNQPEDGRQQEKRIYYDVIANLFKILETRPLNGKRKDFRHELRLQTISMLNLFHFDIKNDETQTRYLKLVQICFRLLKTDSEEIATVATKILNHFVQLHTQQYTSVTLNDVKEEIIDFCESYLSFLGSVPSLAQKYPPQQLELSPEMNPSDLVTQENLIVREAHPKAHPNFQTFACRSLKLYNEFLPRLLRREWLRPQIPNQIGEMVIERLKEKVIELFIVFPQYLSEHRQSLEQSRRMLSVVSYLKAVEVVANLIQPLGLLINSNLDYIMMQLGDIVKFFVNIARSVPGNSPEARFSILQDFYQFNYELHRKLRQSLSEEAKHHSASQKNLLRHYFDPIVDPQTLFGNGQPNEQIVWFVAKIVQFIVESTSVKELSPYNLAKAIQIFIMCILSPACQFTLQTQLFQTIITYNNELRLNKVPKITANEQRQIEFGTYDLQIEILTVQVAFCKQWRKQTEQGIKYFAEKEAKPNTEDDQNVFESLSLKESELVEVSQNAFFKNWKKMQQSYDQLVKSNAAQQYQDPKERQDYMEKCFRSENAKKEMIDYFYYKTIRNTLMHVEAVLVFIKDVQARPTFSIEVMKLLEKLLVHICHIIHNISQFNPSQDEKQKDIYKSLHACLTQLQVNQFRDLIIATGDTIFGLIIEARVKGLQRGMAELSRSFIVLFSTIQPNVQQQQQIPPVLTIAQRNEENFKITFIELFFEYTKQKISVFDTKFEENGKDSFFGLTKQDKRLAQAFPFQKIQEALQKKLLTIGEQCLQRANDVRVKHTFFGIFVFCIQQIRSGQIVPKYFYIIRNLWKEICNIDDHSQSIKEIQRDYIPMIQGLIQTFLQQKDEVNYVKWPNEICCFVPAKLKHLLDYLPEISKPLVDCMESNQYDQIEGGAHTLQYWLSALATYPELLDPVLNNIMPDLNKCIKQQLQYLPNISLKLLAKLGARTRQYDINNEFKPRNYSEDGLKVCLTDKHSKEKICFGIDSVIDVLLIKILSYGDSYSTGELFQAVAFVRCAFISYIDPEFDVDFVIANIVAANQQDVTFMNQFKAPPLLQSFDARKPQESISSMTNGSESHVFEKILRCLIIGCSTLPTNTPENSKVQEEHIKFMEWVTKYFTLIYICKNGSLTQPCQIDEINPLLFIEYVVEFLYFNVQQGNFQKQKSESYRPYYKGSSFAIKTMINLIKQLYTNNEEALDNLEIIQLLIKKICNQVDDLAKNLAVNIAIRIMIKNLPLRTVKKNAHTLAHTLFKIIQQSNDSVVVFVSGEIKPTINKLLERIGIYTYKAQSITTLEDRQTFINVVEKVIQMILSPQTAAKTCAKEFIEKIVKSNNTTVSTLLESIRVNPNSQQELLAGQPQQPTWLDYIYQEEFERKIKDIFDLYRGSYSSVKQLISFLEVGQFLVKHSENNKIQSKSHVFLGLIDILVLILEDETEKFESILEFRSEHVTFGPNNSLNKLSKRYMKLERIYLQQNREYDSYSHTMHTHQFLETNYFEVISEARDIKLKKEVEQLKQRQSWQAYNIFDVQNPSTVPASPYVFEKLHENALTPLDQLGQEEHDAIKKATRDKIEAFTNKLFGNQTGRVQDICYDYMQDLYEIYPNVSLHCKLISKTLQFLIDIVSHPEMHRFIKGKQNEFFKDQYQSTNDETRETDRPHQALINKLDYYTVEVKAKMICLLFKFFQRDESIIHKQAKSGLKRLLSLDNSANEALPNYILKECVRPILNCMNLSQGVVSQNKISYYQHFGKLIKVCYTCFNEELGKHLTVNYQQLEKNVRQPYQQPDTSQFLQEISEVENRVKFLVDQYNTKIRQIETACGIIDSLHFLCQQRPQMVQEIQQVMRLALNFNEYLISEFQAQFDEQVLQITADNNLMFQSTYDRISPLRIQLGHLQSDIQQGVAKFVSNNFNQGIELLSSRSYLSSFLQIVNKRENFSIREKMSRDGPIRGYLKQTGRPLTDNQANFDDKFVIGINLVHIFSRYNPSYLVQQRNSEILDVLRQLWVNKQSPQQFLSTKYREIYTKILKILVIYSRNEKSDTQILFDLLKDFSFQVTHLDIRPLIKLCTVFIPQSYSVAKKTKLMVSTLEKIQTSTAKFEAKYCMFEFAFMPIALQCAKDAALFKTFFTPDLIYRFFRTFFLSPEKPQDMQKEIRNQNKPLWRLIQEDLQERQRISYQNFFTEIVKVTLIIIRSADYSFIDQCCPAQSVFNFLDWNAKHAVDQSLKELAYFTMSCFGVKYFGLQIAGEAKLMDAVMIGDKELLHKEQYLSIMQANVLVPILEYNLGKSQRKQLFNLSLQNVMRVCWVPQYSEEVRQNIWKLVKQQYCREPDLSSRIAFCALISNVILQSDVTVDLAIYRALAKTIFQYHENYHRGFETLKNFKEPFSIIQALIHITKQRKIEAQGNALQEHEIKKDIYEVFTSVTCIFEAMTCAKSLDYEQDLYITYSQICLQNLRQISEMFPAPESYSFCIGYDLRDAHRYQYQALFKLNFFSLSLAENFDLPNKMKMLLDFFKILAAEKMSISSINYRLVLLPIQILKNVMKQKDQLLSPEQLRVLKEVVTQCINLDFKKVNTRSVQAIQIHLVDMYNLEQQKQLEKLNISNPAQIPFVSPEAVKKTKTEEIELLQKCVPHFAIRVIKAFEDLRNQGVLSQLEFDSWIEPDYYKNMNNAILKLVSVFRLVVTSEKTLVDLVGLNQPVLQTYEDYEFKDNMIDFSLESPNFDTWLKESMAISLKSIVVFIKQSKNPDEAFQLFENLKQTLKFLKSVKCCYYLTEKLYEITYLLVIDQPCDTIKLLEQEKGRCLLRLANSQRLKECNDGKEKQSSLVNKVYAMCLDFLDTQPSLQQNEVSLKVFDRLFLMKPCCSYELRQRLFQTFENFTGSAIKHKINYFMFKVSSDDYETFLQFCQIKDLLDFLLYSFKQDTKMTKIRESSKLITMHDKNLSFQASEQAKQNQFYLQTKEVLTGFHENLRHYTNFKLEDMLLSLSEIVRINPEHSHDRGIAEKIFSKIFWQIWEKVLQRQDHHLFAADFNKMAQNLIKYYSQLGQGQSSQARNFFSRTMFEQVVSLRHPQVRVEPEVLQFMAKNFSLWHIAIPMLEDHVQLFPLNERYVFALQELYDCLMEEDYSAGLSKVITHSREMRSMISQSQHHMWEELNTQFSSYINFYAEQEGLFPFLEHQQRTPGKYSRQIAKNALIDMINGKDPLEQQIQAPQNQEFSQVFETRDVEAKLDPKKYPKAGSNRNFSEIDLRTWESLYMKSLRLLKVKDLFKDIADNITNEPHELKVDYYWTFKEMSNLNQQLRAFLTPITSQRSIQKFNISPNSLQKVKYYLYQNFILGTPVERQTYFEENHRETVKLVISQWSNVLPQYMDRIHNEYLILFQQIIESIEGGRSMITIRESRNLQDYRCAMNIWRERLPNMYESIETWQEILESRNFIFANLRDNFIKQQQTPQGEVTQGLGKQEEPVDICWNNLKLAEVSRKHGHLGLAQHYLNLVKAPLTDVETKGEILKLERYRFMYENFKLLHMITGVDSTKQQELLLESKAFIENKDYEPWMHADIQRLAGEYFLQRGDLSNAKTNLLQSIEKNRKEAKTWLSYAKLNETILSQTNQEKTLTNSLKGYMCALSVSQHKSRLIIPYILRLLKNKTFEKSQQVSNFAKINIEMLPAWLWLFWMPQLLSLLKQPKETISYSCAKIIFVRLCKLYPQATYYPLKAKCHYTKQEQMNANPVFRQLHAKNKELLIQKNAKAAQGIECFLSDVRNLFSDKGEKFIYILQDLLNFSSLIQQKGIEKKILKVYQQVYDHYLKNTQHPAASEFFKHFIDENTREPNFLVQMQILKNIKDFLVLQKSLKVQTQHAQDILPSFSNLNVKGIELPDQYTYSPMEPIPQKIITIERVDTTVHRSGWNDRKIEFKCQNSKSCYYLIAGLTLSKVKQQTEITQFYSDERVTQMKIIMNMMFLKHKESYIRGTKMHVSPKTLLLEAKMSADDLNFVDFQETHDFLLLEQGLDADQALLLQLKHLQNIFDSFPADKFKEMSSLDQGSVRQLNQDTYNSLTSVVEPHLLQSYFNRIFYNVDNLFIFKKQFTRYFAVNSFFSYVFNQTDQLKLNSIVFCKSSGKVVFSDYKLNLALQQKDILKNKDFFQQVEKDCYYSSDRRAGQESHQIPFRLTPNLANFIGQIGLQGLFAGMITSVALALTKHEEKFGTLLKLVFADEIDLQTSPPLTSQATAQAQIPQQVFDEDLIADFCTFRIRSLVNNNTVLPQPPKTEELKAQPLGGQKLPGIREERETLILGQQDNYHVPREYFDLEMERPMVMEEFNKNVYKLIEIAQEDSRRGQRPINWCAWF